MSGTWETLSFPVKSGRIFQQNEEGPMSEGESDRSIVLGDGRADHMGKGATDLCSL